VQPAAGDDGRRSGGPLPASQADKIPSERFPTPFLGPSYSRRDINAALPRRGPCATRALGTLEESCAEAARLIAAGRVVAWYRGRMEFGPRALGHRSILADPGHPAMRDRINAMVKMREAFRPFAPAVSLEQVHKWFEVPPMRNCPT